MRTFGRSLAIQTSGPDAVEDVEATERKAQGSLLRLFSEHVKQLHTLGYRIDPDSFEPFRREEADRILIGYTVKAQQTIPMLRRILQAVRRG